MYTAITSQSKLQDAKLEKLTKAATELREKLDYYLECFGEYTEGQEPHTKLVEARDAVSLLLP